MYLNKIQIEWPITHGYLKMIISIDIDLDVIESVYIEYYYFLEYYSTLNIYIQAEKTRCSHFSIRYKNNRLLTGDS